MRLTFLGTGTSHGIPVPGCTCSVCQSSDPHDKRMRTSILLEKEGRNLVVDTGPEFRLQALRAHLMHVDAVLYTHSHADHFNGIDDLRSYSNKGPVDVFGDEEVVHHMQKCFGYAFLQPSLKSAGLPHLVSHTLEPYRKVTIAGFEVTPIPLMHGKMEIYGYRIDDMVYATDCNFIPPASRPYMEHAGLLVLDALRPVPHPTHFSIGQAVEEAQKLCAKETYLVHFCHDVSHGWLLSSLPSHVHPAYDTLSLEV